MTEKTIGTLIEDIQSILSSGIDPDDHAELIDDYGEQFKALLSTRLDRKGRDRKGMLRMSNAGKPCERQVYYDINDPEGKEELRPETYMKFLFGDLVELLTCFLVEASGHLLEGTQDTQEISGIKGHRDGVIDGMVVDIKSASSYSFKKFENGTLEKDDPFGYITQIQSYVYAAKDDPVVTIKDKGAFLVIDKVLGKICLDVHEKDGVDYSAVYDRKKEIMSGEDTPPRRFSDEPDGASGNRKLGINCSYCDFKKKCWPSLQTFFYSNGPRHLTTVKREPKVGTA